MNRFTPFVATAGCLFTLSAAAQTTTDDQRDLYQRMLDVRIDGRTGGVDRTPPAAAPRGGFPVEFVEYFEDFQTHPLSTDPVFDRFQVIPGEGQIDPTFEWELFSGVNAIPSLFVDGQTDAFGTPDPLPRWQGVVLKQTGNPLSADVNDDGSVDAADLGIVIAQFGMAGAGLSADINGDGIVDAADLGALIGAFGDSFDTFCVYEATQVYAFDDVGDPLPPGALDSGPFIGDRFGFASSPACGMCDTFTFQQTGTGVNIIGEWTLIDLAAPDLAGVSFFGDEVSFGCDDWDDERVLALVRGESGGAEANCCFGNVRGGVPGEEFLGFASDEAPLICEMDVFIPSHASLVWADCSSTVQGLVMSRMFTGGVASGLTIEFSPFANEQGLIDRFLFLGSDCGVPFCGNIAGVYGSAPDPDYVDPGPPFPTPTPLPGKKTLTGEWFTVRHVVRRFGFHEVWVKDSETMAMTDPNPGDDGRTTATLLDDIEDGFVKLFPAGPFGRMRLGEGQFSPSPSPAIATSVTSVSSFFGNEDSALPRADRNFFLDNIRISGLRPVITPPPLTLPYADGMEQYIFAPFESEEIDMLSYSTAGRWESNLDANVGINDFEVHTGDKGIDEERAIPTGPSVPVFWTHLPRTVAAPGQPCRVGAWFLLLPNPNYAAFTPLDTVTGVEACTVMVAVAQPDPLDLVVDAKTGATQIHVRQRNPHFDPKSPAVVVEPHLAPPDGAPGDPGYPNIEYINVATGVFYESDAGFAHVEVEVDDAGTLRVFFDGAELFPADPARFYDTVPGDITAFRTDAQHIDQLRFDNFWGSGYLTVDDITLTGAPAP